MHYKPETLLKSTQVTSGLVGDLDINEKLLPREIDLRGYPHLAEIRFPKVDVQKVSLIIEQELKKAHIVQEVKVSPDDTLGWTIAGKIRGR